MYEYQLGLYEKAFPDDLPLEEKLLLSKELGYDFMEFCVDLNPQRAARLEWSPQERRRLREFLWEHDLRMTTFSLSLLRAHPLGTLDREDNETAFQILRKGVDLACDLGCRVMLINGYDVYATPSTPETQARYGENIAKAASIAARRGMVLAVENAEKAFMDSIAKAARWVRQVNNPYFRIYGDIGNVANAAGGNADLAMLDLECGRGLIAAMHLKDTMPGEYRLTRYGEGHVDFPRSVAKIQELGIRIFTAELFCQPRLDWRAEAVRVNGFLRSFFQ